MKVRKGKTVRLSYRVTTNDGRVVEQALSGEPLVVVQGTGQLSERVEQQIDGLSVGDTVTFQMQGRRSPSDASTKPLAVPRDYLPPTFVPRIGTAIRLGDSPNDQVLWVREIQDDHIVVDPRDSLDGAPLTVRLWILGVVGPS